MKKNILYFFLFSVAFASCKKDKDSNINKLKDLVYEHARESYLWYDALPDASVFNPRQYQGSSDLDALRAEVDAFSQLKINPNTNLPYEYAAYNPGEAKYSYIDAGQAATSVGGTGVDAGFSLGYQTTSDLRVRYVYSNSPASAAGMVRGYRVTAINGNTSLTINPNAVNDKNYDFVIDALAANSITLTLQKFDGTSMTVTITKGTYKINPVIKYSIITTANNKKVGYFAFSRFTVLKDSNGNDVSQSVIDEAFNAFTAANVTELVVDLRYNGGGAVETAQYLSNYIVPATKTGTVMYTEYYNNKLQNSNHPLLSKTFRGIESGEFSLAKNTFNFAKKGSLNLNRAFFLVTGNTASASEVLINNLAPVMPQGIQIIGRTTYGKPVGFFGIPIGDYDLYITQFETRNSAGTANYYQGMVPGVNFPGKDRGDDITKDFGDPTEGLLAQALKYINDNAYSTTSYKANGLENSTDEAKLREINFGFDSKQFKGTIHTSNLKRITQ
jgi:carboxyl-terminal processing protease